MGSVDRIIVGVRRLFGLIIFLTVLAVLSVLTSRAHAAEVHALGPADEQRLQAWYGALGGRRVDEPFGELVARAGGIQIGKPYRDPPEPNGPEALRITLGSFQCVSFVESSLALARCVSAATPSADCFAREVEALRYRGGTAQGPTSRLHYFNEWLSDNAGRQHLLELTTALGGAPESARFDFVTSHRARYPFLAEQIVLAAFLEIEARLSATPLVTLNRATLRQAQDNLQTGDIVAIVSNLPGSWISHTGLIVRDKRGGAHLLHASKPQGRVVQSKGDIAAYVESTPVRRGLMAYRPLAP